MRSMVELNHEKTRNTIKCLMLENDIRSERALAIACGMSQATLNRFLSGRTQSLDVYRLRSLSKYFSITISQLIGEIPLQVDPKINAVERAMSLMSDEKKNELMSISNSFSAI